MPQKLFEPFRKLPQQFHNLNIIQKLHDLTSSRTGDLFGSHLGCTYGCFPNPTAVAFDVELGLLALGSEKGVIKVYGSRGIVLTVQSSGSPVVNLLFLPQEGRLLSASSDGSLSLFELEPKTGTWSNISHVKPTPDQETITSLALGVGIVYVGTSAGTVHQVAVQNGRLCLGDTLLTSCTSAMVTESVPIEKRQELGADSAIVSLEIQPGGTNLLIAYAGGCVVVAVPQPAPQVSNGEEPPTTTDTAPIAVSESQPVVPYVDGVAVNGDSQSQKNGHPETAVNASDLKTDGDSVKDESNDTVDKSTNDPPVKDQSEKRATLKLKEFTKSLRRFEITKQEVDVDPPIPLPPAPRVSHILLRDQPVEWASWRVTNTNIQPNEVTVAYGDGAFQVWPITTVANHEIFEPVVVSKRDPPSTPYGPLPCGPIGKIVQCPCINGGGVITAFSGGLPRAEFHDRHAVSVLQDQEHVCFDFGSPVIDFLLIPQKSVNREEASTTAESQHITVPAAARDAAALLVLTERELIAIDLQQPNWPTFPTPYLTCLDISPVTAVSHLTKVSDALLNRLRGALNVEFAETTSSWPVWGGQGDNGGMDLGRIESNEVVVLGHANGWVTLLNIGLGDSMHRLGTFHTDSLFSLNDSPNSGPNCRGTIELETWPPFRRVGDCALTYPFCVEQPDPRLAVTQLTASISDDAVTIVVGGAAGQVSLWTVSVQDTSEKHSMFEPDVSRIHVTLNETDQSNPKYIWKGLPAMRPLEGFVQVFSTTGCAFTPRGLIQLDPPAPVTAIALESSWNLLALGSPHGFALIDLLSRGVIYTDFSFAKTVVANNSKSRSTNMQTAIVNRGKQISAQMRQSFRRLKHLRTSTISATPTKSVDEPQEATPIEVTEPMVDARATSEAVTTEGVHTQEGITDPAPSPSMEAAPVREPLAPIPSADVAPPQSSPDDQETTPADITCEVQCEPIPLMPEEFGPSTIRSILFADTFVVSPVTATAQQPAVVSQRTPSLWIGTANGRVSAHSLSWEGVSGPVGVQLLKELQLQHHASVIGLCIVDASTHGPVSDSIRTRTGHELDSSIPITTTLEAESPTAEETTTEDVPETMNENSVISTQSHQLLVCSEEQVKLFQLPTLRALHKFKSIDRLHLPGHSSNVNSTNSSSSVPESNTTSTLPEKAITDKGATEPMTVDAVTELEIRPAPQPHRKTLTSFGLQAFSRGVPEQPKTEWNVVVSRFDGQIVILSMPNLRKLFKVSSVVDTSAPRVPHVTSMDVNFVFWHSGCQLLVTELSPVSRLTSVAVLIPGAHDKSRFIPISLPEWARPKLQEPVTTTDVNEKVDENKTTTIIEKAPVEMSCDPEVPVDAVINGATTEHIAELVESATPLAENYQPTAALHAGDVTLDSIKEYLNGEGTVIIKTVETSSEKRTVVEGGHVLTTLRETERVDGQLTKDDILKFSTEDQSTTHVITEIS